MINRFSSSLFVLLVLKSTVWMKMGLEDYCLVGCDTT
jgi:hypothetical protein